MLFGSRMIVICFALLCVAVVSCRSAGESPPLAGPQGEVAEVKCPDKYTETKDWIAVDDSQPPGRRFSVTGKVVVPTAGYSVTLMKRIPQGSNPAILLLDLNVTKPSGIVIQVITTEEPRYGESQYSGSYTSVEIYCGSERVASPRIQAVH